MHGIRRVIVFCTLTTILPTLLLVIPLYLRHSFYANVAYAVTESDILEITDGISTIFCSEHTLQMNGTFNAFQMSQKPEVTSYRKHIRLKKSMLLPDDTLEYWGFYLLKGATVALSVCSRFQGASLLVVKGERNLRTCGMLDHNGEKQLTQGIFVPGANRQVKITFESNAQEINSGEPIAQIHKTTPENMETGYTAATTSNQEYKFKKNTNVIRDTKPGKESLDEKEIAQLFKTAESYVQKHTEIRPANETQNERKLRHARKRFRNLQNKEKVENEQNGSPQEAQYPNYDKNKPVDENNEDLANSGNISQDEHSRRVRMLKVKFESEDTNEKSMQDEPELEKDDTITYRRRKRSQELVKPPSLLDQGIRHGGNAGRNTSDVDDASSVSSFENGLFNCYGGSILLAREFPPSDQCTDVNYLLTGKHMQTTHNVIEDGYYYYIFYSDNDFVSNDLHALFDIYKPTFQYENVTKSCINQTECSFSLSLMSPDRVIVEIPTRDGIEHEVDDVNLLISVCHPRMGAYIIFPIAVLFFILSCAFM